MKKEEKKERYTPSIDKIDGSPSILKDGEWFASFATVHGRDRVLAFLNIPQ